MKDMNRKPMNRSIAVSSGFFLLQMELLYIQLFVLDVHSRSLSDGS